MRVQCICVLSIFCLYVRPATIAHNIMPNAGASAGWSAVGGCLRRTLHSAWRSSCGRTGCGWATSLARRWSCWPCFGCSRYSGTAAPAAVRTAARRRVCCPSTMTALRSECYLPFGCCLHIVVSQSMYACRTARHSLISIAFHVWNVYKKCQHGDDTIRIFYNNVGNFAAAESFARSHAVMCAKRNYVY